MTNKASAAVPMFEQQVWHGQNAEALSTLLRILGSLSSSGGQLPPADNPEAGASFPGKGTEEVATRLSAAISELLSRPDCRVDARTFQRFVIWHRWLHVIFNASSFGNGDFVLKRLGSVPTRDFIGTATIDEVGERIFKLMLATASGRKNKSEVHGDGQPEFVPWSLGAVM